MAQQAPSHGRRMLGIIPGEPSIIASDPDGVDTTNPSSSSSTTCES